MRDFFRRLSLFLNITLALLLLSTKLTSVVSPIHLPGVVVYVLGLAFPVLVVLNVLYFVHWFYRLRWSALISLSVLLLCYPELKNTFPIQLKPEKIVPPGALKITTGNVGTFVHGERNFQNSINAAFEFFNDTHSDIICMQEMGVFRSKYKEKEFRLEHLLSKMKAYPYSHLHFLKEAKYSSTAGNVIFSKYPIVSKGEIEFSESTVNVVIYADIRLKDQTVRVYSVHFESNRLKPLNQKMYDKMSNGDTELIKEEIKFISKSMRNAARKRAFQVREMQKHIDNSPYPVIIMGDFNDTPVTYTYRYLRKGKKDAFVENGRGLGITYNGKYPAFRIDYFLYDPVFKGVGFERHSDQKFSDHYPISCSFELPKVVD